MLSKLILEQVIDSQEDRLAKLDTGISRELPVVPAESRHALIISGIRRCGKSTLLQQINKTYSDKTLFINFEDPRLSGFDISDFNRLKEIITLKGINILFFDEIQNIEKWETFVRFNLDEGYRIFITGSNAAMLSKELGTKLTGRHISKELFPFSYGEFLRFKGLTAGVTSSDEYINSGGFPDRLKTGLPEVMMNVFNDIVVRDIALRHNIRNITSLQQLAVWLVSNTGKPVSGNNLRKLFSIASSSSIMEYLSFMSDAYLFFFVPRFSYSQKVQLVNPKKVYAADNGLIEANSVSFSDDRGRLLENLVYLQLRRQTNEIFYFKEKRECDFVAFKNGKLSGLFQVCWQTDQDNLDRELSGMTEALTYFRKNEGVIITHDQEDVFIKDGKKITAIPFYKWAGQG